MDALDEFREIMDEWIRNVVRDELQKYNEEVKKDISKEVSDKLKITFEKWKTSNVDVSITPNKI